MIFVTSGDFTDRYGRFIVSSTTVDSTTPTASTYSTMTIGPVWRDIATAWIDEMLLPPANARWFDNYRSWPIVRRATPQRRADCARPFQIKTNKADKMRHTRKRFLQSLRAK